MLAFIIWSLFGILCIGIGIYAFHAKKAVTVWTWDDEVKVHDIKNYNHAIAKWWIIYGIVFIIVGTPLLYGQNNPLVIMVILGCVFDTILFIFKCVAMDEKYRK